VGGTGASRDIRRSERSEGGSGGAIWGGGEAGLRGATYISLTTRDLEIYIWYNTSSLTGIADDLSLTSADSTNLSYDLSFNR